MNEEPLFFEPRGKWALRAVMALLGVAKRRAKKPSFGNHIREARNTIRKGKHGRRHHHRSSHDR